jgi:hypothetical protein
MRRRFAFKGRFVYFVMIASFLGGEKVPHVPVGEIRQVWQKEFQMLNSRVALNGSINALEVPR